MTPVHGKYQRGPEDAQHGRRGDNNVETNYRGAQENELAQRDSVRWLSAITANPPTRNEQDY